MMTMLETRPVGGVTQEERDAFLWMQARMVELLLRHNVEQFGVTFGEYQADPFRSNEPQLQRYRDLAVVIYLQDELFNHIVPGIKRRLSFVAPRQTQVEPLPGKGRIDWPRTAAANWRERPGEVPLEVHTHQRRRNFATPENLLTVVTLLEYRQVVQRLLDNEIELNDTEALRHPLNEIVEQCRRELAFLQFAGLLAECEEIVGGYSSLTTEELEEKVAENLLPGHNSAYADLLAWRQRLWSLSLLDRTTTPDQAEVMLGADPQRDNYLYQLWLFYELGHLLDAKGCLKEWDYTNSALTFTWGIGEDDQREYRLQHDQSISLKPGKTQSGGPLTSIRPDYWTLAPGVRPDFYIQRTDQVMTQANGQLLWHEPGYVLDAKYYKPKGSLRAPASPVKRMLADLQLTGERYGALLFAFQKGGAAKTDSDEEENTEAAGLLTRTDKTPSQLYTVRPHSQSAQFVQPDVQVGIWRLRPSLSDESIFEASLTSLLDQVHAALKERVEVRCRGVFLDGLSANAQGELANLNSLQQRNGIAWPAEGSLDDLLLCPKPHIAPWRIDLVSLSRDCCQNPRLCHIKDLPGVTLPQRLTALDEIKTAIRASDDPTADEEQIIEAATRQVTAITRRYADLIKPNMQQFIDWLRTSLDIDDLFDDSPILSDSHKETLALARFLAVQVNAIQAHNYAGPVLLFTGTLEEMIRATIYRTNGSICANDGKPLQETLGTLANCLKYGGYEWNKLQNNIKNHWHSKITPRQTLSFEQWVRVLKAVADTRNLAAHSAQINPQTYNTLTAQLFGSASRGMGILNGFLLAWNN